jgi:hypothetical protein
MRVRDSSLATSTILSLAVGLVLFGGLLPVALKASKTKTFNPIVEIEQIVKTFEE